MDTKNISLPFVSKVSAQEMLFFTKHLATMIKSGIPITDALDTLLEQTKSSYFKETISGILDDIKNGKNLATALEKHPEVFDQFYISLVAIAEESGTLDSNLEFLAKQLSKNYSLKKKIQGALMYPGIVFGATVLMGGFIALYILPQLVDFFGSFQIELPFTTKILVVFSKIMKDYGGYIVIGVIVIGVLLYLLTRNPKVKPFWHTLQLRMPIVGLLISYGQLARFSRNLGTLIKSGVPVSHGIEITAETLSNYRFKNDLLAISRQLTKGKNIGDSMREGKYDIFPPIVSRMISVGEKTGRLDETLLYLGDFYEDEVDDISKNLSTILEPILLIGIGLVVGFVALSIISPIYQITGSIHR